MDVEAHMLRRDLDEANLKIGALEGAVMERDERIAYLKAVNSKAAEEIQRLTIAMRDMREKEWRTQEMISAITVSVRHTKGCSFNPLIPLAINIDNHRKLWVEDAILTCDGDTDLAAKRLGISLATLYRIKPDARKWWMEITKARGIGTY